MNGVVLAAGKGKRLRPLTESTPKSLVEVGGKPILTHCFERLRDLNATEIVVVVGYRGRDIRDHYGDAFDGIPITYAVQEEQKGMAHALLQAEHLVDDDFMLMDGDNVIRDDLERSIEIHRRGDVDATLLLQQVDRDAAKEKMICRLDDENKIVDLKNKPDDPPENSFVATGFHTFPTDIFPACKLVPLSERGEYELSDVIELLLDTGRTIMGVECRGWLSNINTPEELEDARTRLS